MRTTRYLIVGGGMTADAAVQGHPRSRRRRHRSRSSATSRTRRTPVRRFRKPSGQGGEEHDLARHRRARRRAPSSDGASSRSTSRRSRASTTRARATATSGCCSPPAAVRADSPFGGDDVIYFRTLDDYRRLRALADEGARFVVIGGGFIGSEIAAALAMNGRRSRWSSPSPGSARASSRPSSRRS